MHYVDQGVTVQGQITDNGAKVLTQFPYYSSTNVHSAPRAHCAIRDVDISTTFDAVICAQWRSKKCELGKASSPFSFFSSIFFSFFPFFLVFVPFFSFPFSSVSLYLEV